MDKVFRHNHVLLCFSRERVLSIVVFQIRHTALERHKTFSQVLKRQNVVK